MKDAEITVGIIGAGIAGCTTALELADQGFKVSLFESSSAACSQTSDATPCRLGILHYMDLETALSNLTAVVALEKYLKETTERFFQVGEENFPRNHSLRRVQYVISTESLVPVKEIKKIFSQLKKAYGELIAEDPKNEVFGPVENFYRILEKEEEKSQFKDILDLSKVEMVIDTCETLFDWPLFKKNLLDRISKHENIIEFYSTCIEKMEHEGLQTRIATARGKQHTFDFVVNSTWNNVDRLNQTLGFFTDKNTINRVKCMAIVNLPKKLEHTSLLVGYGAFCALSSRGDGKGYLTYEPVTNMGQYSSTQSDWEEKHYLEQTTEAEKRELGKKIIKGASQYIPLLKECTFDSLKIGIVRTDCGKVNIYTRGEHFKRTFSGVTSLKLGLIGNESRKHTYWFVNAKETLNIISLHLKIITLLQRCLKEVESSITGTRDFYKKLIVNTISVYLSMRFFCEEDLKIMEKKEATLVRDIGLVYRNKAAVYAELLNKRKGLIEQEAVSMNTL